MAAHVPHSIAIPSAHVRTGNNSLTALVGRVADPAIAVLVLMLTHSLYGLPFGSSGTLLAAMTFALSYPGDLPFRREPQAVVRRIAASWAMVAALLLALGLMTDMLREFDPNLLATWLIATPLSQTFVHLLTPWALPKLVALRREQVAIVIGANGLGRALARQLSADPISQTRVAAFFDDRDATRIGTDLEAPVRGDLTGVTDFVRANRVDQIYIALPMASQPRILKLLDQLRDTTASIFFVPDIFMYDIIQARVDTVVGMPVVAVCETPFHGTTGLIKRMSDMLLACVAIVLTAPIMLAAAIAVKTTSPGPVIFRQRRYGLDGQEILVWKFRSMRVQEDGERVVQATQGDSRITPVGAFMRRTSIDELPQFFNVLQGRMSVVGPRPHAVSHNEMYRKLIKGYMIRHKVKPGITGWAQVNGARGETDTIDKMRRRIDFDLEYLRNWSLRLDLLIVWKTFWQAVRGDRNAY
jgi:putative colanic acid biosysnthesis UDP-glucose lipid carrier transferase